MCKFLLVLIWLLKSLYCERLVNYIYLFPCTYIYKSDYSSWNSRTIHGCWRNIITSYFRIEKLMRIWVSVTDMRMTWDWQLSTSLGIIFFLVLENRNQTCFMLENLSFPSWLSGWLSFLWRESCKMFHKLQSENYSKCFYLS